MTTCFEEMANQVPGSTAALMEWLHQQLLAGFAPAVLEQSMHKTGWSTAIAQAALQVAATAAKLPAPLQMSAAAQTVSTKKPAPPMPAPDMTGMPLTLDAGDRHVQVLMSLEHPRVVLFGNLLSPQECEQIIRDAQPHMSRSRTVGKQQGENEVHPSRTSEGMFFQRKQTATVAMLEARIAKLLNWPQEYGEGLQVLNYHPGAEYKPHYDYFGTDNPNSAAILARGGQRVGTLVVYLNDTPAGGCTYFPQSKLRIHPRQGNAVFFSYAQPSPDSLTLHGGDPVIDGEKWIATKWLRERTFT